MSKRTRVPHPAQLSLVALILGPSKVCFKCLQLKPLTEFYRHPMMADGHLGKCKDCTKADVRADYRRDPEKHREYERERAALDHAHANRAEAAMAEALGRLEEAQVLCASQGRRIEALEGEVRSYKDSPHLLCVPHMKGLRGAHRTVRNESGEVVLEEAATWAANEKPPAWAVEGTPEEWEADSSPPSPPTPGEGEEKDAPRLDPAVYVHQVEACQAAQAAGTGKCCDPDPEVAAGCPGCVAEGEADFDPPTPPPLGKGDR